MSNSANAETINAVTLDSPIGGDGTRSAWLSILGPFALRDALGQRIAIRSKKNRALLAILALSPNCTAPRDKIATLLWGDHGDEQARNSLRQSLAVLRKELGPIADRLLQARDEMLALQTREIGIDALELLAEADRQDISGLRRVAGLVRGELLADLTVNGESFEDWLAAERSRFGAAAIRLFDNLSQQETGIARIEAARQLLALDPLRESSHRMLMRAYMDQGDNGLALKQYEQCRALLRSELQIEPAKETQELSRAIARGDINLRAQANTIPEPEQFPVPQLPDRPSIAVLPFGHDSADPERQYFSDGISEDLIANLSRFRHLFVIARASSFCYRSESIGPKTIGRQLGVQFLLYGTVRLAGNRLRVTAELVAAESEVVVWVEKYDRSAEDVFDVIDELSSTIVASTVGHIDNEVLHQAKRKQKGSFAAYELTLRGRALMHSPRREDKLAARRMFEDAIAIDRNFAMGWAQLAYTHLSEFFWDDSGRALESAADIASQALLIDEEEAWCHMVLGLTHLHQRHFDLALIHCERSVSLNPNDPGLAAKLGLVLTDLGRPSEAIVLIEKAMRLSPRNPQAYSDYLALALFGAGRYEEALKSFQSAPDPSFYYHAWLAACHVRIGDLDKARFHGAKSTELAPNFTICPIRRNGTYPGNGRHG